MKKRKREREGKEGGKRNKNEEKNECKSHPKGEKREQDTLLPRLKNGLKIKGVIIP